MATPSNTQPAETSPNPVSQVTPPTTNNNQDVKLEVMKETSPASVFVNSEPIREDQVQNAIKFLSHPKVMGSPVMYRRSFLERKGLTKEEIDEAFRRVPDQTPSVSATQPVATNQVVQAKSSPDPQPQPPTAVGHVGTTSKTGMLTPFHWSHALLAVGVLSVSGAGAAVLFKKSIIPRLKSWIRKVVVEEEDEDSILEGIVKKPSVTEEAAAAAKSAAAAAADVAQASQELLITKSEEKRLFEELISMVNAQFHEMRAMSSSIQKLEGQKEERNGQRALLTSSRQLHDTGKADSDTRSASSLSPPAFVESSVAPHPKSYMEPWEASRAQYTSTNTVSTQDSNNIMSYDIADNQPNGSGSGSRWQQKNVRITEMDNEQTFRSSSVMSNERLVQRSWVPPQPPPVTMAEAATAIRQPKKALYQQEEQMTDDQLLSRAPGMTDELQRITKMSESGNGESSGIHSSEIQREENVEYLET